MYKDFLFPKTDLPLGYTAQMSIEIHVPEHYVHRFFVTIIVEYRAMCRYPLHVVKCNLLDGYVTVKGMLEC